MASATQFNLPLFPHMEDDQVRQVVATVAEVVR
jgi:dTDP-4-amino-4,6-dideoxygalactose transaminase